MKITIDRNVLEQALDALQHGITEMNHRGCAIECMPLHHAAKALREALVQPAAQPTIDLSRLEPFVSGIGKAILQELKESLAAQPAAQQEPAGEPVAWLHVCRKKPELRDVSLRENVRHLAAKGYKPEPLYTRPAVPLPIDYFALQRFAQEHGLDYNALCAVAREDYKIGGAE